MAESVIKLENIWRTYKLGKIEFSALKGIDLEIDSGSFVSIMGPSGSGKSTLLNMIGALDFPTKGRVYLKGKDISLLSENQLALLRGKTIGFVFQEFNILPNLTALENVILPMIFQGVLYKERQDRAKDLLISVGLGERFSHRATELSGGERQRVAIARAFANNPEMVIADEPTGNLDSVSGEKIMEILNDFHQKPERSEGSKRDLSLSAKRKTVVIVTHDSKIANYSEKIINIKDGKIVVNHNNKAL
jgi:putative ABC transport system ATP-binding protein